MRRVRDSVAEMCCLHGFPICLQSEVDFSRSSNGEISIRKKNLKKSLNEENGMNSLLESILRGNRIGKNWNKKNSLRSNSLGRHCKNTNTNCNY